MYRVVRFLTFPFGVGFPGSAGTKARAAKHFCRVFRGFEFPVARAYNYRGFLRIIIAVATRSLAETIVV